MNIRQKIYNLLKYLGVDYKVALNLYNNNDFIGLKMLVDSVLNTELKRKYKNKKLCNNEFNKIEFISELQFLLDKLINYINLT